MHLLKVRPLGAPPFSLVIGVRLVGLGRAHTQPWANMTIEVHVVTSNPVLSTCAPAGLLLGIAVHRAHGPGHHKPRPQPHRIMAGVLCR